MLGALAITGDLYRNDGPFHEYVELLGQHAGLVDAGRFGQLAEGSRSARSATQCKPIALFRVRSSLGTVERVRICLL